MGHSRAVEFCEREAKKNAESFEARTMPIFFQRSLFLSVCEVACVRDGMDQNSVFDSFERIWNGLPIADVIRRNEVTNTREPAHQLAEQTQRLGALSHALRAVFGIICFFEELDFGDVI